MNSSPVQYPSFGFHRLAKSPFFRILLVASALAGLLGCGQKEESQEDENEEGHALLGVVQAVNPETLEMTVAHEEIPDFMPPMTMVFRVGLGDVKVFKKGDQIRARMVRDEDGGFRLIKIWKIDDESAEVMRRVNKRLAKQVDDLGSGYYLAEGDAFPEFALLDQYGETVTPTRYKGKPFVLNFIFTRCTDGEMCPLSTSKMARLQKMAAEEGLQDLEFVSVTLDPKYDTPGVLRAYADGYGIDGSNFRFVTGEKEMVRRLIKSMAVTHIEDEDDIIHSLATVLVGRDREIVKRSTKKAWDPEAFLEAARVL
ncbi:SCO family protein [Pelagicoccus mobilis]|uniref:SCO family protein n=1 Tax=Pelagicoccus mobilis TaxID=415221 RepID=A0A934RU21_9BACT|nr:SCO family protein [Pelagicoccus mobilis]MBK1876401.1 SCO family protein [Pelagicoccus mobilis]